MQWWHTWHQRRRWRRELKDVPLHQLRGMVERSSIKLREERWAERRQAEQEKLDLDWI
jgi:hypothetical protein